MAAMAEPRLAVAGAAHSGADMLRHDDFTKRTDGKAALDGVSLAMPGDAYISILGPSGSGKTVLLRVTAGFGTPDEVAVHFGRRRIDTLPVPRRGIGFVFQNALVPHLGVFENIASGLAERTDDPVTDGAALRRAKRVAIEEDV
jgi:putative spermidine/putrescine transport system ATP-binding protein